MKNANKNFIFTKITTRRCILLKRMLSILFGILIVFSFVMPASAVFDSGEVTDYLVSDAYYMQSLDEDTVLFSKNENKKLPMAGFVKIVAAVTAIEKWGDLDEKIKITSKNLSLVKYDYSVRTAGYKEGEKVSKRELINCLVVYSANDAASIIAYEVAGSLGAFTAEMNSVLQRIGCESTAVKNLTGFDTDGQYTTVSDMAKLVKYAMTFPAFAEAFSMTSVTLKETEFNKERTFSATNRMRNQTVSDYYHSAVNAGKQTSTDKAGECTAVVASQDGYNYLVIVMKGILKDIDKDGVKENTALTDAKRMLNWTYRNIRYRVVVSPAQVVAVIDVIAGKGTDTVKLVPEKEGSSLVPSNATPASVLYTVVEETIPEKLVAPVKKGEVIAKAKVYYAGQVLSEVNLVAQDDVKLSFFGLIASGISAIMTSTVFIVVIGIATALAIAYFVMLLRNFLVETGVIQVKKTAQKKPQQTKTANGQKTKKAFTQSKPNASTAAKKPVQKRPQVQKSATGNVQRAPSKAPSKTAGKAPQQRKPAENKRKSSFSFPEVDFSKFKK